jgi:hypothetical protein
MIWVEDFDDDHGRATGFTSINAAGWVIVSGDDIEYFVWCV